MSTKSDLESLLADGPVADLLGVDKPIWSKNQKGQESEKGWRPANVDKPIHDAIIDQVIADPGINSIELGRMFGYHPVSIRRILGSDLMKEKLAVRRGELVDPILEKTVEERFNVMLEIAMERATEIISKTQDGDLALKGVSVAAQALGYGARVQAPQGPTLVVVNPGMAPSSDAWAEHYAPKASTQPVEDATPKLV